MTIKIDFLLFTVLALSFSVVSCEPSQLSREENTPVPGTKTPAIDSAAPTVTRKPYIPSTPSITGVTWDDGNHTISVGINPWPETWPSWEMYVDGVEMPMEGEGGVSVVRPNAPINQPPDGLVVGTEPWVTGLDHIDFPCCGTLQFSVPASGLTNTYEYNLRDMGCVTASTKTCSADWTIHEGDWVIEGAEPTLIEDTQMIQKGNIYIRDSATLILKNSTLVMERGGTPTIHVYLFVDPKATLIVDNSLIYSRSDHTLPCVINLGETRMVDSPTSIHYFDMSGGARLTMRNSEMVNDIGGLLQVTGGSTQIMDSTLGALGLWVPAAAHLDVSGLSSGTYFEHWNVNEMIPEADYELTLDNVTILKDDFSGNLEHGPYERGWIFFLDPDSHVRLLDSELRKVFIDVINDTVKFEDLKVGEPSDLKYRDIILDNVIIEGEWPFTVVNSDLTITNSDYLFLQPEGKSTVRLIDSHIVEFIPRNFTGKVIFENGLWTTAGEIIGDLNYHSKSNNFTITGSLKISDDVRTNLQWKNAQVTREFEVIITDSQGVPIREGIIKLDGEEYIIDNDGRSKFNLVFNEMNYNQPIILEVWYSGILTDSHEIDFFTETPIRLKQK